MPYKSDQQKKWEDSSLYAMLMRRGVTEETEDTVDSFVDFIEESLLNKAYEQDERTGNRKHENKAKALVEQIKATADLYLWRNNPKVAQAEIELLERMKG